MTLPPGLLAARRWIAIAGAVLVLAAVGGALAYASQDVGNGCGNGWEAARKPFPSPLFTDAEKEALKQSKQNPYQAAAVKTRPYEACRRAGSARLVRAERGGGLVLVLVGGILAFLYWPKRAEHPDVVDVIDLDDEPGGPQPFVPNRTDGWPGR